MAWNDEHIATVISRLLRIGVTAAAAVVLLGGILYLAGHGTAQPAYHIFESEPAGLRSVRGVLQDAFLLHPRGIIQLGLLLLIATPIARVAFSVLAFARQGDRLYVLVTIIVLAVLIYSLLAS
jgi:uncharacterized membrane protein